MPAGSRPPVSKHSQSDWWRRYCAASNAAVFRERLPSRSANTGFCAHHSRPRAAARVGPATSTRACVRAAARHGHAGPEGGVEAARQRRRRVAGAVRRVRVGERAAVVAVEDLVQDFAPGAAG